MTYGIFKFAYPDYNWKFYKFERINNSKILNRFISIDQWKNKEYVTEYMEWLYKKLNLKSIDDWHNVSPYVCVQIK